MPDLQTIRNEALAAGALDPMKLRFRVVEYDKTSGEMLGVPMHDIGFLDAVEKDGTPDSEPRRFAFLSSSRRFHSINQRLAQQKCVVKLHLYAWPLYRFSKPVRW